MFGPWLEIFAWIKRLLPSASQLRRPHLNFITIHYLYICALTIVGSVILYGKKNLNYIDALFFASGAATQSGLNTVNVNDLFLYQQLTLYFLACVANPIFINAFVVFVRLYWFEKRFQNVVMEAQKLRRTRSRSRTFTFNEANNDRDTSYVEKGVGDRSILVMHPGPKTISLAAELARQGDGQPEYNHKKRPDRPSSASADVNEESSSSSAEDHEPASHSRGPTFTFDRQITFADEARPPDGEETAADRMPQQRGTDQHIAFVENQRNPKDKSVLYIPGPRDWDRGDVPQQLADAIDLASPKGDEERLPMRSRFMDRYRRASISGKDADHPNPSEKVSFGAPGSPIDKVMKWRSMPRQDKHAEHKPAEETSVPRRTPPRLRTFATFASGRDDIDLMPYLSYQPTVGRNSAFVNLTEEQREELGGIEYRALKTLAVVLCAYFLGFHLLGAVTFVPWFVRSRTYNISAEEDGFNKTWWGIFTSASMFNDLGLTLNPDSMISFQTAVLPLLLGSFLIIIGNTGFPCMLRFVIWVSSIFIPKRTAIWEELRFLLDHPRRCFTLLFPSKATWWLFWILALLNGIDLILFIVLDLNDSVVTSLSPGIRVLCGFFQAASTRTAGFADVNLAELHPAIQVSYLVMMYISVFPIAISVRRTNVYEERSLGIYAGDTADDDSNEQSYVGAHLRRQLSFDLWYVFLGLFIIAIVEGDRLQAPDQVAFTLFSVLFEVVSAYGTVGLSLGYPTIDASFSAEFRVISKLVIIAMQIRGRHRGLPYALDKAILLPSEGLHRKEEDDAIRRRRASTYSAANGLTTGHEEEDLGRLSSRGSDQHGMKRRNTGGLPRLLAQMFTAGPTDKPVGN